MKVQLVDTKTDERAELFFDEVLVFEPVSHPPSGKSPYGRRRYLVEGFSDEVLEWILNERRV